MDEFKVYGNFYIGQYVTSHILVAFPTWQLRLGSYMTRVLLVFLRRSGRTHREEDLTHPTFFQILS